MTSIIAAIVALRVIAAWREREAASCRHPGLPDFDMPPLSDAIAAADAVQALQTSGFGGTGAVAEIS